MPAFPLERNGIYLAKKLYSNFAIFFSGPLLEQLKVQVENYNQNFKNSLLELNSRSMKAGKRISKLEGRSLRLSSLRNRKKK